MSYGLPDDWYIEPTGESRILDQEKVAAEIERLRATERDLIGQCATLRAAMIRTIKENAHLADGEDCTLIHLKRALNQQSAPETKR